MGKKRYHPPNEEEFVQLIKAHSPANPNIDIIQRVVLKCGPQTYKVASIMQIKDPETGEVRHKELRVNSFPFRVGTGVDFSEKKRLARWTCEDGEIEQLRIFLEHYDKASTPGEHTVIKGRSIPGFEKVLDAIKDRDINSAQLAGLVSALAKRVTDLRSLPELGEDDNVRMVAAALRVTHRNLALKRLSTLIEEDALEPEFQELLEQNWWMLGGQYISMIPRREWTVEDALDILLETADRYFEIIELKRSKTKLFIRDHDNWIVSAEVNKAVNQAAHYISEIEADRGNLLRKYKIDLYKLCAKVLIGNIEDDEEDEAAKREALKMYNSHLHRIQVITFDELERIVDNVVHANLGESGWEESGIGDHDIPF
ncbi:MAG: DUF4263 domain-containing protein [Candidatus Brocadiales bacterium]|nr:DUF4263 domain-containing protein [Candidatus Bathyanammoxibius sp.]